MLHLLWLIPGLPLLSFLALTLEGGRMRDRTIAYVGVVPAGLAASSWSLYCNW